MLERVDYESALLPCERCKRPTRHGYVGGRPVHDNFGDRVAVETLYACDACGRRRVWGCESPEAFDGPLLAAAVA